MTKIAFIGGTGLTTLPNQTDTHHQVYTSPYGEPSALLTFGKLNGHDIVFLPRHGKAHTIPPHQVNYRANIYVLHELGVDTIVAVNAVGGITPEMAPKVIAIPDQIIDYTYSRPHTFFDGNSHPVKHIDFTRPYCESLRQSLISAAANVNIDVIPRGTYAATQGPRLETTAEIDRFERDGCHLVGMTGMPEASLAREMDICYASICIVANEAAGRGKETITIEQINDNLSQGMDQIKKILEALVQIVE